jgi:starch synthase
LADNNPLKICFASSEFAPLAKTGGLADVNGALSTQLLRAGHDVRVLLPDYATLNREGLFVERVDFLQGLSIQIGPWNIDYAIDRALLSATGVPVYLLRCPALYDRSGLYTAAADEHLRFIFLSRAAIEMCQRMQFAPDIFHCHDWHTSLIPLYLKTVYAWDKLFAGTRSVVTIHNIGYQGIFSADILPDLDLDGAEQYLHQEDLAAGRINFLKTGLLFADLLTTVSPTYAREIQGEQYGMGLHKLLQSRSDTLVGILNGVDDDEWNPENDALIPQTFSRSDLSGKAVCKQTLMRELGLTGAPEQPLIGVVTRLVGQKGIDLMQRVLPLLLTKREFSLAVLGSGEPRFEQFFSWMQQELRSRVCFYRGYNNRLAHWIEAGSDMFLMPSIYEPCGLNQMYSLKYGTVPIVRETGGLADSVQLVDPGARTGTGIVFREYDETRLAWAINLALDLYNDKPLWKQIMNNGMSMDFSWQRQAKQYVSLFRQLSGK